MPSRPQIAAGVTVLALGGLTAVSLSAGDRAAGAPKQPALAATAPPAVVKTVIARRTIRTKSEQRRDARLKAARNRAIARHRRRIAREQAAIDKLRGRKPAAKKQSGSG